MVAGQIGQQFIFVTFVVFHSAVETDGSVTCQTVEVKALALVLCARALLLRNGLFVLFELFDRLQGVVLAELVPAVMLGATLTQEQTALQAVGCGHAILALLAYELRLPRRHALCFDNSHQRKVELQRLNCHSTHGTTCRAGEPIRCIRRSRRSYTSHSPLLLRPGLQAQSAKGVKAGRHTWRAGLSRLKRLLAQRAADGLAGDNDGVLPASICSVHTHMNGCLHVSSRWRKTSRAINPFRNGATDILQRIFLKKNFHLNQTRIP